MNMTKATKGGMTLLDKALAIGTDRRPVASYSSDEVDLACAYFLKVVTGSQVASVIEKPKNQIGKWAILCVVSGIRKGLLVRSDNRSKA